MTAWKLMGNLTWLDQGFKAYLPNGRVGWEEPRLTPGYEKVVMRRLVEKELPDGGYYLHTAVMYVDPETTVILHKVGK